MTKVLNLFKTTKRLTYFFALLFGFGGMASVSSQTIRGIVVDRLNNEPLISVSVLVKGEKTDAGTVTDIEGKFEIKISKFPTTIAVSYIGFKSEEIDIYEKPSEPITVFLQENINALNEVVVVGYGSVKKGDLTGSVASIKTAELQQSPIVSIDQ
jgi:hypothetical protein